MHKVCGARGEGEGKSLTSYFWNSTKMQLNVKFKDPPSQKSFWNPLFPPLILDPCVSMFAEEEVLNLLRYIETF